MYNQTTLKEIPERSSHLNRTDVEKNTDSVENNVTSYCRLKSFYDYTILFSRYYHVIGYFVYLEFYIFIVFIFTYTFFLSSIYEYIYRPTVKLRYFTCIYTFY